ncbi:pro-sigmaK processing inhibitor BofA family protein [Konateibacter massiliensis]|uniref:pro-sigmaK processing inhibitor BofA family protein n=1 Tax=Konateibacter massiliensis TaxID=2002841 RepID=UPI000C158FCE|nr:pro-sigmaK processing inhibitor BofA family protein [Konateibacter massiliensis]
MSLEQAVIFILVICAIVLIIVFAKNKVELLVNVILRMIFGAIGIHILNAFLLTSGVNIFVGINIGTVGTIGALGVPGFALLYAIALFQYI